MAPVFLLPNSLSSLSVRGSPLHGDKWRHSLLTFRRGTGRGS
ncbi:hypothetical protein OOU_Y34scaffold00247g18 [Pyricularia oryzae Y34]|uniref:Uncharacterized protein n=2 Tax=Pyricularia oryzae TaxID=318829 RepID=A0AA97PP93_PYRO3|nr:hypothetical protein OOU_Y34scaffold00247g18 [Pyricularia oryzae Y34]